MPAAGRRKEAAGETARKELQKCNLVLEKFIQTRMAVTIEYKKIQA